MTTFEESICASAMEFCLLRERAEDKKLFDRAVEWMHAMRFKADTKHGRTVSRDGEVARFTSYDWAHDYEERPNFVFFDYFRGHLLNKYSRLVQGADQ